MKGRTSWRRKPGPRSTQAAADLGRHRTSRHGRGPWQHLALAGQWQRNSASPRASRRASRAEGAAIPEIPRQERQARRARRKAAGGRDAGKPARRRHHADREILHPQQRADSGRDEKSRRLEDHHRRRGQQEDRDHARRVEIEIQGGDAAHGAGMRRQRPRRHSRRRRAATSGAMAAPAVRNGPAWRWPTC